MNHFHYRFTPAPKGSPVVSNYDLSGAMDRYGKIVIGYEDKDKYGNTIVPHYHIFGITDESESTTRNWWRDKLSIPKTTRGKASAYSCLEWNKYDTPEPSYVCKWGSIYGSKGYSPDEIEDYIEKGRVKFLKAKLESDAQAVPVDVVIQTNRNEKSLEDKYDEYSQYVLPGCKDDTFTYNDLKKATYRFFRLKSRLLPPASYIRRFMLSAC